MSWSFFFFFFCFELALLSCYRFPHSKRSLNDSWKISDALAVILGPQYNPETIWTPRSRRRPNGSAFTFVDSQGRFSSFLMRLEGRTGKAQGYNKLMYHLDVKATERAQSSSFNLSQTELDRVSCCSTCSSFRLYVVSCLVS